MQGRSAWSLPLISLLALLLSWELTACWSSWSADIFPGPFEVMSAMGELIANGSLLRPPCGQPV